MKKYKFTWEEIGIEILKKPPKSFYSESRKVRKILLKNVEIYVAWVLKITKTLYKKKLKKNEKFNACAFYMNKKNNEILEKSLRPMDWLCYSPVTLEDLEDNEYAVKIEEIVQKGEE